MVRAEHVTAFLEQHAHLHHAEPRTTELLGNQHAVPSEAAELSLLCSEAVPFVMIISESRDFAFIAEQRSVLMRSFVQIDPLCAICQIATRPSDGRNCSSQIRIEGSIWQASSSGMSG